MRVRSILVVIAMLLAVGCGDVAGPADQPAEIVPQDTEASDEPTPEPEPVEEPGPEPVPLDQPEPESESQAEVSVEQQNAVRQAASYLDFSAFSRSGLIDQLAFERFTAEQAAYGADQAGM